MKVKTGLTMFIFIVLLFPFVIMVGWSVAASWPWPNLIPQAFTLRAFSYLIDPTTRAFKIMLSSIMLSSIVTILTLIISIPAARALAFYNFKGKSVIKILILLPLIVPMLTVSMGVHIRFIQFGLANTFLGVVLIHVIPGIPYGVKILLNVFELNGNRIESQARTLGASSLQVMRYVTLPMITPGLIIAGSIIYIASFSQYFITFLIGGGRVVTFAMFLFPFVEAGDRTMASALSIGFILSIVIVLFVSEKIVGNFFEKSSQYYV
jgi:putative spermidine/putrescine transport system permease protein